MIFAAVPQDPCNPSPCGANTICLNGPCVCLPEHYGDPYTACRPECVQNPDCPLDKACVRNKCFDPCTEVCGQNAKCTVINHTPMCACPDGMSGNAFAACYPVVHDPIVIENPCNPSPCGPNSRCQNFNNQAVCTCISGFIGNPPACRPECVVETDCPLNEACIHKKCADPCIGSCGIFARCEVLNRNPICSCPPVFTGDPFAHCIPRPEDVPKPINPCQPSPCGPNAQCQVVNDSPSCSCMPEFVGIPPSCRPECISNSKCPSKMACINRKCRNPCPRSCHSLATCYVVNHVPICTCPAGYTGDPFVQCAIIPSILSAPNQPCQPSPCGTNAVCREQNGVGSCTCLPKYVGNPYQGCRPECTISSDCPAHLARPITRRPLATPQSITSKYTPVRQLSVLLRLNSNRYAVYKRHYPQSLLQPVMPETGLAVHGSAMEGVPHTSTAYNTNHKYNHDYRYSPTTMKISTPGTTYLPPSSSTSTTTPSTTTSTFTITRSTTTTTTSTPTTLPPYERTYIPPPQPPVTRVTITPPPYPTVIYETTPRTPSPRTIDRTIAPPPTLPPPTPPRPFIGYEYLPPKGAASETRKR